MHDKVHYTTESVIASSEYRQGSYVQCVIKPVDHNCNVLTQFDMFTASAQDHDLKLASASASDHPIRGGICVTYQRYT